SGSRPGPPIGGARAPGGAVHSFRAIGYEGGDSLSDESQGSRPVKVLVVEDDPVIAMGLEQKLIELGYGVAGRARTGKTAVERVLREPPDAILLDLMLPDLDGIEVARLISAGGIHVPVVVITAHEDPQLVEQAISVGVAAYLLKPVSRAQLGSAVELAISRQAEFEALRADVADLRQALET